MKTSTQKLVRRFPSFALASLLFGTANAAVTLVDLTFEGLPSGEGFTYTQAGPHSDDSESSQFTVNGGILSQVTVGNGQGSNSAGNARYRRIFTTAETLGAQNFRFEMSARVTSHEQTRQDFSYAAFTQNIYINNQGFFMGIKPNELSINGDYFTPSGFDGTVFHAYRIDVDLVADTYEFFLDNISVRTGAVVTFASTNSATFGDGTGTANANGERSSFVIATNIPEPSSALLVGFGIIGTLTFRRRIKRMEQDETRNHH